MIYRLGRPARLVLAFVWTACDSLLIRRPIRTLAAHVRSDTTPAFRGKVPYLRSPNQTELWPAVKKNHRGCLFRPSLEPGRAMSSRIERPQPQSIVSFGQLRLGRAAAGLCILHLGGLG
jgi:hypothetical protein